MNPTDFINYLLYVVPGFFAVEFYRSKYPAKKESDFARLIWSIFYSILIYGLALWLEKVFKLGFIPTENGEKIPLFKTLFFLFGLAFLFGLVRIFWHKSKIKISTKFVSLNFLNPDPISTWAKVNRLESSQWVLVILKDGAMYLGWISDWSFDPDSPENECLLKDAKLVNENLEVLREINGNGVYLRSSNISRIEFH